MVSVSRRTGEQWQLRQTCTGVSLRDELSRASRRSPHDSGSTSFVNRHRPHRFASFSIETDPYSQIPLCFQPSAHATTRLPDFQCRIQFIFNWSPHCRSSNHSHFLPAHSSHSARPIAFFFCDFRGATEFLIGSVLELPLRRACL